MKIEEYKSRCFTDVKIEEYRSMIGLMTRKQIKDELEKMRQAQWENECIDRWAAGGSQI
jgi:hypothetical protein